MNIKKFLILPLTLSSLAAVGCIAVANNFGVKGSHVTNAASLPTIGETVVTRPDFPSSKSNAWLNENHNSAYVENGNLVFEHFSGSPKATYALDSSLEVGIGDYIYNEMQGQIKVGIIHFRVIDNVLEDIRYEACVSQTSIIAGTYMPRNYVVFSNDDDNITNLNPSRSVDQMILPNEEYNLYIIKPEKQGQSNFHVEIRSYVGEDYKTYGYISLNPKEERTIDHLAFSLDGTNYTDILSYPDYCEDQDKDAFYIEGITGLFYIKSVAASTHTLLTKHDKVDATCEQDGHLAYYECECDNIYFEDQTLLKKIGDETALDAWLNNTEGGKIEATGHDAEPEFIGGTMSDCTHDGNYGYYHCTKCDKYFSDLYLENEIVDLEEWKAGDGKMAASHHVELMEGQEAKCYKAGWKDYYKCSLCDKCFEDEECTIEIENLEAWKTGKGKITVPHTAHKINGVPATCTTAGYKDSYKCSVCEYFFEDEACTILIGDDTPWFEWCVDGGKLDPLEHHGVIQDGKAATTAEAGWKDYYKCSECGKYFEEIGCINEITDLEAWKIGNGKIDKLSEPQPEQQPEPQVNPTPEEPKEGLSGGAIAGIVVGSIAGVSLISYGALLGVFIKTKKAPKFLIKSFEAIIKLFKK